MITRREFTTALIAVPSILRAQQAPLRARLKIDTERVIGDIDPKIYGNFIEHLGRCIDGGIFEEGSPLSDGNGFRKDVMEATKNLNVTAPAVAGRQFCIQLPLDGWNRPAGSAASAPRDGLGDGGDQPVRDP